MKSVRACVCVGGWVGKRERVCVCDREGVRACVYQIATTPHLLKLGACDSAIASVPTFVDMFACI